MQQPSVGQIVHFHPVTSGTTFYDTQPRAAIIYKKGIVEVLRVDTNSVVRHRPMTDLERQSPLFKANEKRSKKKDDEEQKGETQ